jgi:hypothetical protein
MFNSLSRYETKQLTSRMVRTDPEYVNQCIFAWQGKNIWKKHCNKESIATTIVTPLFLNYYPPQFSTSISLLAETRWSRDVPTSSPPKAGQPKQLGLQRHTWEVKRFQRVQPWTIPLVQTLSPYLISGGQKPTENGLHLPSGKLT